MAEQISKILIIETDLSISEYFKKVLQGEGYLVDEILATGDIVEHLCTNAYDLVLIDIDGSRDGGMKLVSGLAQKDCCRFSAIMLLVNLKDEDQVLEGLELGAVDYVTKPIHRNVLLARVRNQIKLSQTERKLHQSVTRLEEELKRVAKVAKKLRTREKELERYVWIDGLTGIFNRRKFDDYLLAQWHMRLRSKEPISLLLCDIDLFKQYNDFYGHQQGDTCLVQVAQLLSHNCRRYDDVACRYGGEEFCIILPGTDEIGAMNFAKQIQTGLAQKNIPHEKSSVRPYVTLSIGVATVLPTLENSEKDCIKQADKRLYVAKNAGRDQICTHHEEAFD